MNSLFKDKSQSVAFCERVQKPRGKKMSVFRGFLMLFTVLVLVGASCLLAMPPSAEAAGLDWYVNGSTGNDAWDGTSPVYVSGIIGPKQTIQAGVNVATAGDNVNVAPGTYYERVNITTSVNLIGTNGAATTIINGLVSQPYVVFCYVGDTVIDGFTVTYPDYTGGSDASGIVIRPNSSTDPHIQNIRVTNCVIHDIGIPTRNPVAYGSFGINTTLVDGLEIDNCEIYNIKHADPVNDWANAISIWAYDAARAPTGINIHDNVFHDIDCPQPKAAAIGMQDFCDGITVRDNTFTGDMDFAVQMWGNSNTASTIDGNTITNSDVAGIYLSNPVQDVVTGNTVTGCESAIQIAAGTTAPDVQYNSLSGNTNYGLENLSGSDVDGTRNWWGSVYGPTHPSNPDGTGDVVSDDVTYSPWCTNSTRTEMVSFPAGLLPKMTGGIFGIPVTATEAATPYIRAADEVGIAAVDGSSVHTVTLPTGSAMSREAGGNFATADLLAEHISPDSLSGFNQGTTPYAGMEFGISGETMLFDSSVTVGLFVGTGMNGEQLSAMRSVTGNSNWSTFGIVSSPPPVSGGYVEFQASRASYYAAVTRGTAAPGSFYYFAEGYTGEGFQEYLCIGNPNAIEAAVDVTYLFPFGETQDASYLVPAQSRLTVDVNEAVGPNKEVSIQLQSEIDGLVAERPMYFDYTGSGYSYTGGHDVVGATALSTEWYFAEGYTGPGFDNYICVLNPGGDDANLTLRFQTEEAGEIVKDGYTVPAHSRSTYKVNDVLGNDMQNSLKLESTQPVVAERPMYFRYSGPGGYKSWTGGHCVMGTPAPSLRYYFAEGTTRDVPEDGEFQEWLCLQNPNAEDITVNATYHLGVGQGDEVQRSYTIEGGKRFTVYVADEVGKQADVSVFLACDTPFMAERPMYFNYRGQWTGGHCVIGSTAISADWYFAEGYTGDNFQEWFCLQNPGTQDAVVEITYYVQDSETVGPNEIVVPAGTRQTVYVNDNLGSGKMHSTRLSSSMPIVIERPMYFNYDGDRPGGHDVIGFMP